MKQYLLLAGILIPSLLSAHDFKPVAVYGSLLYNILAVYVQQHPDATASTLRSYLNSTDTKIIFDDAYGMGYTKRRVIKSCYYQAMSADPFVEVICHAIQDDMKIYIMWKDVLSWIALGCASFSTISCFGLIVISGRMYREYLRS